MKKLRLEKWVKYTITIILIIFIGILLAHFICANYTKMKDIFSMCDKEYGHICSTYEARKYAIGDQDENK